MNQNDLIKIVGKNIKIYREKKKITKEQLATLTNLSISHITNLENEKTNIGISINNLYKISTVLETPISKFLENTNDK